MPLYRETHRMTKLSKGFTLLEIMISVAILAILSTFAFPLYTDYIRTGELAKLQHVAATITTYQEDYRLRNGTYLVNQDFDPSNALSSGVLTEIADLGWAPTIKDVVIRIKPAPGTSSSATTHDSYLIVGFKADDFDTINNLIYNNENSKVREYLVCNVLPANEPAGDSDCSP